MARGRKAEPAHIKEAKGNPGRRPLPKSGEDGSDLTGGAPEQLTKQAAEIWVALSPELIRLKFLKESDRPAFMRYCEYAAEWWDLKKRIAMEGHTYWTQTPHGKMQRVNPCVTTRDKIEKNLKSLEDVFGMSPAMRQTIMQRMAAAPTAMPVVQPDQIEGISQNDLPESPLGLLN